MHILFPPTCLDDLLEHRTKPERKSIGLLLQQAMATLCTLQAHLDLCERPEIGIEGRREEREKKERKKEKRERGE